MVCGALRKISDQHALRAARNNSLDFCPDTDGSGSLRPEIYGGVLDASGLRTGAIAARVPRVCEVGRRRRGGDGGGRYARDSCARFVRIRGGCGVLRNFVYFAKALAEGQVARNFFAAVAVARNARQTRGDVCRGLGVFYANICGARILCAFRRSRGGGRIGGGPLEVRGGGGSRPVSGRQSPTYPPARPVRRPGQRH